MNDAVEHGALSRTRETTEVREMNGQVKLHGRSVHFSVQDGRMVVEDDHTGEKTIIENCRPMFKRDAVSVVQNRLARVDREHGSFNLGNLGVL